jgi:hypothetical protein
VVKVSHDQEPIGGAVSRVRPPEELAIQQHCQCELPGEQDADDDEFH